MIIYFISPLLLWKYVIINNSVMWVFIIQLTIEQHGFKLFRSNYAHFFSINVLSALRIPRFPICKFNQPQIENIIFPFAFGNLWMRKANCMHYSVPLYIRAFSICRFGYLRRVLEPITHGYWRTIAKFWGSQKLYTDFSLCRGSVLLTPALFKGQLYILVGFSDDFLRHIPRHEIAESKCMSRF